MTEEIEGVYVMRVAARLCGMHPQTLRKYERAGLLRPSRSKRLRMYSDEDIARLKTIKRLVDDLGLNLAGVDLVLKMRDVVLNAREDLAVEDADRRLGKHLADLLDEVWRILAVEDESSA